MDGLPSNHSPFFAPVVEPTLRTGITALTTAARTYLAPAGLPSRPAGLVRGRR